MLGIGILNHLPFSNASVVGLASNTLIGFTVLIFLYHLFFFVRNVRIALKTNFNLVVLFFDYENILWQIVSVPLRPLLKKYLPDSLYNNVNVGIYGWEFKDRERTISRWGKSFIYTTSSPLQLNISDADVAADFFRRTGKETSLPTLSKTIVGQYGSNMMASEGDDWSRQRKLIQPTLNEKIMATVWDEASRQAREMMSHFFSQSSDHDINPADHSTNNETMAGLKNIAINVLVGAGYGQTRPWYVRPEDQEKPKPGFKLTYLESVTGAAKNMLYTAFLPSWFWKLPFLPQDVKNLGDAHDEFPRHTAAFLDEERSILRKKESAAGIGPEVTHKTTFINLLARIAENMDASDETQEGTTKPAKGTLTQDEMVGNLFLFTVAGFDTTANTMAYAVAMLAAQPEWQGWIREEIDHVRKQDGDRATAPNSPMTSLGLSKSLSRAITSYNNNTLQQHPRLLALMFETLRLFTPLLHIPKSVNEWITVTDGKGNTYNIPPNITVHINACNIHTDEEFWGEDALKFDPRRWIVAQDKEQTEGATDTMITAVGHKTTVVGNESVRHLTAIQKRHFIPWSAGPRSCPGMKMSQVEFCSVMLELFARFEVQAVFPPTSSSSSSSPSTAEKASKDKEGAGRLNPLSETEQKQARERLEALIADSQPLLTLQMQNPQDVWLRWSRREDIAS